MVNEKEKSCLEQVEIFLLLQNLPEKMSEITKTTYQHIVEYGEEKKENQVISKGLESGLSLELLATLTGLSVEKLQKRIQELGLKAWNLIFRTLPLHNFPQGIPTGRKINFLYSTTPATTCLLCDSNKFLSTRY